ncbi:hypothetical protein RJT34_31501 [Clitoria ternatea]|uniref:Methyltransferase n=1 Tax=Clitoria ternatea TaxID=43366 RepID=A0AAN9I2X8_CLITE
MHACRVLVERLKSLKFCQRLRSMRSIMSFTEVKRKRGKPITLIWLINNMIFLPVFMSLVGGNLSILHPGESLRESIKRHEHFLALQLGLKPGQKVLDVGCGIGGPLREISRFSSTSVIGLNNNEYQISRGKELNHITGVDKKCDFVKADFMKMPFPDNSFDAVYAIEATCHAPDAYGCYKEIFRVLKPGQHFAAYEWCMTDAFDPNNEEHQKIKAEIEIGDGLPDIRSTTKCLEALQQAGFEIIWEKDLAVGSPVPWYFPLDTSTVSLSSFRLTSVGRLFTRTLVKALEYVGLAPEGSLRVQMFLEKAADGLVDGGKKEIFTPMYFFLVRKPDSSSH